MTTPSAETAYLFRHALLRDAAYQMQLPGSRGALHGMALTILEQLLGTPPPVVLDAAGLESCAPHASDSVALELAWHAHFAADGPCEAELLYLRRGAHDAARGYRLAEAAQLFQMVAAHPLEPPHRVGYTLRLAVRSLINAGSTRQAREATERVIELAIAAGNRKLEGMARSDRAALLNLEGAVDESAPEHDRALEALRASGHEAGIAHTLQSLGNLWCDTGRLADAHDAYQQALEIARRIGNSQIEARVLGAWSVQHFMAGRHADGIALCRQAMAMHRANGDRRLEAESTMNLAHMLDLTGEAEKAAPLHTLALAQAREVGDRTTEATALGNLGARLHSQRRVSEARDLFRQALQIDREIGHRRSEGISLHNLASAAKDLGELALAEQLYLQGLELHRQTRDKRVEAMALANLAELFYLTGRRDRALEALEQAIRINAELGDQPAEAKCREKHAQYQNSGAPDQE